MVKWINRSHLHVGLKHEMHLVGRTILDSLAAGYSVVQTDVELWLALMWRHRAMLKYGFPEAGVHTLYKSTRAALEEVRHRHIASPTTTNLASFWTRFASLEPLATESLQVHLSERHAAQTFATATKCIEDWVDILTATHLLDVNGCIKKHGWSDNCSSNLSIIHTRRVYVTSGLTPLLFLSHLHVPAPQKSRQHRRLAYDQIFCVADLNVGLPADLLRRSHDINVGPDPNAPPLSHSALFATNIAGASVAPILMYPPENLLPEDEGKAQLSRTIKGEVPIVIQRDASMSKGTLLLFLRLLRLQVGHAEPIVLLCQDHPVWQLREIHEACFRLGILAAVLPPQSEHILHPLSVIKTDVYSFYDGLLSQMPLACGAVELDVLCARVAEAFSNNARRLKQAWHMSGIGISPRERGVAQLRHRPESRPQARPGAEHSRRRRHERVLGGTVPRRVSHNAAARSTADETLPRKRPTGETFEDVLPAGFLRELSEALIAGGLLHGKCGTYYTATRSDLVDVLRAAGLAAHQLAIKGSVQLACTILNVHPWLRSVSPALAAAEMALLAHHDCRQALLCRPADVAPTFTAFETCNLETPWSTAASTAAMNAEPNPRLLYRSASPTVLLESSVGEAEKSNSDMAEPEDACVGPLLTPISVYGNFNRAAGLALSMQTLPEGEYATGGPSLCPRIGRWLQLVEGLSPEAIMAEAHTAVADSVDALILESHYSFAARHARELVD
jgi:hypothetical protein